MGARGKILKNIDFKAFVNIFNTQGKKAAVKHVSDTYGVKYDTIVKRLRLDSEYIFDQSRDRYILKSGNVSENPFLSIEELCSAETSKNKQIIDVNSAEVISRLIKDKFFEISKYVTLENSSMKLTLRLDTARNAGYEIDFL